MSDTTTRTGSAAVQGRLWSVRTDDWAAVQEQHTAPAFQAALDALEVGAGTRLLDLGCGAGLALRMAADRGAEVAGLDASEAMLAHARRRVPGALIVAGDLEALPFPDGRFDAVTGLNSFQYAARPVDALREARRVLAPGGRLLALIWAPPEQCQAAGYLAAVGALLPPPPPGAAGPFALSSRDALRALLEQSGLDVQAIADVTCVWRYPDEATAIAGLMAAGPVVAAIEHAGEEAVHEVTREFLNPFRSSTGGYEVSNDFRYAVAAPR